MQNQDDAGSSNSGDISGEKNKLQGDESLRGFSETVPLNPRADIDVYIGYERSEKMYKSKEYQAIIQLQKALEKNDISTFFAGKDVNFLFSHHHTYNNILIYLLFADH